MTHSMLAIIVDIGKDINFASALVVIVAMILQAAVFITCMVLLSGLWRVIFAALQGLDEPKAKILMQLLGAVSAEGGGNWSAGSPVPQALVRYLYRFVFIRQQVCAYLDFHRNREVVKLRL
jgi:hypothetical protein